MLNTSFRSKKKRFSIRQPPVCDMFSRTLAAPVNSSLSGSIGTNYSLQVKNLQVVDKQIVFVPVKLMSRLGEQKLKNVATEKEELLYVLYGLKALEQKVQEKRNQYRKYVEMVEKGIPDNHIAPYEQKWGENIKKLVPYMEKKEKIDEMMDEVVQLYNYYMKCAVLDYLLLDPEEQRRLGLNRLNMKKGWGEEQNINLREKWNLGLLKEQLKN